ncbi:MAG: hypothetical protein DWP97_00615 [Calditrichaeota bacterium]|nr:MAG: hypothetical protein DWP97_00615 [Calditrichota bacterium]
MDLSRRIFLKDLSKYTGGMLLGGYLLDSILLSPAQAQTTILSTIYVAKNGTPAENVAKVIDMKYGGIENFIGADDVIVINPNGQWGYQGASNCACCMGLIDVILNRPGGFNGEIIFCENTQGQPGYWDAPAAQLVRNGPYNFNDMIAYYHTNGYTNVNGVRLLRNQDDNVLWPVISSPAEGQGWVRPEWTSPTAGCLYYLPYPVIRSPYSNKLIDLKNGVYENGYANQPDMKFIKVPNLNNHGEGGTQDYAGITSATKSFLGIAELENSVYAYFNDNLHGNLHAYNAWRCTDDANLKAFLVGEAVAGWMNLCRKPDLFLTTAEWVGWESRTSAGATLARTVGICEDPVALDFYMSKYVMWPCNPSNQFFDPDHLVSVNKTRQTLDGCNSLGYGTVNELEMSAFVYDFSSPAVFRFDIDRMIKRYKNGEVTDQDVLNLIDQYNTNN